MLRTRCFECNKVKNTTVAFSEKQQNDLRNGLASGQVPVKTGKAWITCRDCIGTQHTEMQCVVCERFKGLDGFAKSQRRNPDNAVSPLDSKSKTQTDTSPALQNLYCGSREYNSS